MTFKRKLIIIAGPQSSGKTTLFNFLKKNLKNTLFLEEVNPFTIVGPKHLGGAFVDLALEKKIIEYDLKRLKKIIQEHKLQSIIEETGVFHLVYLKKLVNKKIFNQYLKKYLCLYKKFFPMIVFIDTKPKISWKRRRNIYLSRIQKQGIKDQKQKQTFLKKYANKIFYLYDHWLNLYQTLPFKKIIIRNSYKKETLFLKEGLNFIQNQIK